MHTVHTRTLLRALEICGSREALAQMLSVSVEALAPWLEGKQAPPPQVYFDALDVVAGGPLRRSA